MIKIKDINKIEQSYKRYNLRILWICNEETIGNNHIAIFMTDKSIQVYDTEGAETLLKLIADKVIEIDMSQLKE